jgi:hypothetical protein
MAAKADGIQRDAWNKYRTRAYRVAQIDKYWHQLLRERKQIQAIRPLPVKHERFVANDPELDEIKAEVSSERSKLNNKQITNKRGHVYVMTNPAWPGFVKVGKSADYEGRVNGFQTHSPHGDYVLEYKKKFEDRNLAEQIAHSGLLEFHHQREWFKCSAEQAIQIISQIEA